MGSKYKNVYKNIFINEHEQSNVMEDHKIFLEKMKKLKLYMVKLEKNGVIKKKIYLSDWAIHGPNYCSIIVIIHDKCIFSANDGI